MSASKGSIHFEITADNDDLKRKLAESRQAILNSGKAAEAEGAKIEGMFKRAAMAAGGFFTVQQALSFGQSIVRVRGEMQMMEKSFEVLLQSKSKAMQMIAEIKQLAIDSPLEMPQVSGAVQTLLGFGVSAEKVMGIVGQLSDVSMGNADRFQSLALVYAQTQAAGKLMGQDLLQMINAGFNPLQVISEQTGKSIAQLKDDMSAGAISAEMVADAFATVTSEGGKFYQMTQKQAEGIVGLQASLEDAITNQMNKFGEKNEELIADGLRFATSVVENADTIGKTLATLVVAYGSYKGAIIAVSVAQKLVTVSGNINAWLQLAKGMKTSTDAQVALNMAMGANPILKIISLLIAAGTALYLFANNSSDTEKELTGLAKSTKSAGEEFDKEAAKIQALNGVINNGKIAYDERKRALNELKSIIPGYNAELNKEGVLINNNTSAIKDYLAQLEKQIKMKAAQEELEEAYRQKRQQEKDISNKRKASDRADQNAAPTTVYGEGGAEYQRHLLSAAASAKKTLSQAQGELDKTNKTISELNAEIENTSTSTTGTTNGVKSFTEQLQTAAVSVSTLKTQLADLKAGKGNEIDFAKAIEGKEKELKEAQSKYDLLSGIDSKGDQKAISDKFKSNEERIKAERELKDMRISVAFETEQAVIDSKEQGFEKEMAQINLNYRKKQAAIELWEREQRKIVVHAQKAKFLAEGGTEENFKVDTNDTAFSHINEGSDAKTKSNNTESANLTKEAYKAELDQYAQYAQTYLGKVEQFKTNLKNVEDQIAQDRAKISTKGKSKVDVKNETAEFDKKAKETILGVKGVQEELLGGLDEQMQVKSQTFVAFVETMVDMNLGELLGALNTAKAALEAELAQGNTGDNTDQLKAQVEALTQQIEELTQNKKETKGAPSADPAAKWKGTLQIMNDVKGITNDIMGGFDGMDETTEIVLNAAMDVATGVINMIMGITLLTTGAVTSTTVVSSTASAAIKAVEKASVILAVISAAIQIVMAIANVLKSVFNDDNKTEKEIRKTQVEVDKLDKAYRKLEKSIEDAYSSDAAQLIEQGNVLLEQQNEQLEKQKELENSKKKPDTQALDEYNEKIEKNNEEIEENKKKAQDAIFGTDVKSAIDDFASAYMEAWASGEDRAKSQKDVVKNMIRGVINEMVKSNIGKTIGDIRAKIEAAMEGGISAQEEDEIDALVRQAYIENETYTKPLEKWLVDQEDTPERESAARGIATASQESVDENNGRLTTMQEHTNSLNENIKLMTPNVASIKESMDFIRDNAADQLVALHAIRDNTAPIATICTEITAMKNDINTMMVKGVKMI